MGHCFVKKSIKAQAYLAHCLAETFKNLNREKTQSSSKGLILYHIWKIESLKKCVNANYFKILVSMVLIEILMDPKDRLRNIRMR